MTPRPILKTRIQMGSTVNKDIWEKFQSLSQQTKINMSKLLDESMEDLIEKYRARGLYHD